jgi:hypothetical protein
LGAWRIGDTVAQRLWWGLRAAWEIRQNGAWVWGLGGFRLKWA